MGSPLVRSVMPIIMELCGTRLVVTSANVTGVVAPMVTTRVNRLGARWSTDLWQRTFVPPMRTLRLLNLVIICRIVRRRNVMLVMLLGRVRVLLLSLVVIPPRWLAECVMRFIW